MRSKLGSIPFDDPSSYFITITVPYPPKIKIKIPKLLAKTMQKRFHVDDKSTSTIDRGGDFHHDHADDRYHEPKRTKLGKLPTLCTVRSMFANVVGSNEALVVGDRGSRKKGSVAKIGASKPAVVIGEHESARKLVNAATKRMMQNRRASGVVGSLRRMGSKRFDLKCLDLKHANVAAQQKDSFELCKKRILMGRKCKPLTISGALHYDKYGVLLPEEIP